jgi:hypothetical protein
MKLLEWCKRRWLLPVAFVSLTVGLAACGPEDKRERGGDRGADVGNVGTPVQVVGDADRDERIFYQLTPAAGTGG